MKCPHCPGPTNRTMLFAFKNGKPVFVCTRHQRADLKDPVTDWMRVPRFQKEVPRFQKEA